MTIDERYKYLRLMKKRHMHADRREQGMLLDEMEQVTGLHRKSLIRLLNSDPQRQPRRKQRGRVHGTEIQGAVHLIAESLDYVCAERLTPHLMSQDAVRGWRSISSGMANWKPHASYWQS